MKYLSVIMLMLFGSAGLSQQFLKDDLNRELKQSLEVQRQQKIQSGSVKQISKYKEMISQFKKKKVSLEKVYDFGRKVGQLITKEEAEGYYREGDPSQHVPGFRMGGRIAGFYVDPEFFVDLAKESGTKADLEFFGTIAKNFDKYGNPLYLHIIDHEGACINFGGGALSSAYKRLEDYGLQFPASYKRHISDQKAAIIDEMRWRKIKSQILQPSKECDQTKQDVLSEIDHFEKEVRDKIALSVVRLTKEELAAVP